MLWREAHLSGKSWRFSCCWSPAQTDALSDEVQHEWSEGLQLALHLLFDFQEQAGVWTEVIPLLCGLQFVQYSLCYSTPICCFDLIHHSYGGIEHLPSKWRWIAHCVWRLAAAQGGRQVLESSLTNEKCCTMVLIKTGAFSEGSEQGLECWACFLLLAGGFWRRSSSLECLSPCYNCCKSFWQAAASGVILLAYRAGEILWFCVCPVSTEHNFSCKIMTLSSIELVQHCTLLSYEMSMTCSGVSLDEGEDVHRGVVITAAELLDDGFFCRRFCSCRHLGPAVVALRGMVYVQCCEQGSNPWCADWADVRSLEFTSPPPCLCLFPPLLSK